MLDFQAARIYNIYVQERRGADFSCTKMARLMHFTRRRIFMTPKSYITLCIAGILYVILAATAVVSPHGNYALSTDAQVQNSASEDAQSQTPEPVDEPCVIFRDEAGTEIKVTVSSLKTFSQTTVTVDVDGAQVTFTAAHLDSVMEWSGLQAGSDMIVVKGDINEITAYRTIDLQKEGNSFLIYADAEGNPLDKEVYGDFCVYVAEGSKHGFFRNTKIIDFG